MIDIRLLRSDPDGVRAAIARRHADWDNELDQAIKLDADLRLLTAERDDIRAQVKGLSKQVGEAKRSKDDGKAAELSRESRRLGEQEMDLGNTVDQIESVLRELLLTIPNLPADNAPDGVSENDNVIVKTVGFEGRQYDDHQRVPHWEIGEELGLLDMERGAKMSGSMFVVYRKQGASLVRALCQYALDRLSDSFEELRPPTLVRTETMVATGYLPKFEDDLYRVERDGLWAIPTAEAPLTSLARDEILPLDVLPMRLMAHTSCFRREAGAAGRDTRGLLRVHEFDKVEMMTYASSEQAPGELDYLISCAERNIAELGLPYRVLEICTGDMSSAHRRSIDIEVYSPGVDKWLEVSSISWFGDYQARRANVRYRPDGAGSPVVAHTLNGSALAVPRVWAALVETYRQPDGSIVIPEVLQPYMRGASSIASV